MLSLALIAHDGKKDDLVAFVKKYEQTFAACTLTATGTTGGRIMDSCPSLKIARVKSGPLGGDQQIGALIADEKIDALIFFIDPLTAMPHDVDVKALTRLAVVYDIPVALNRASAELLLHSLKTA